MNDSLEMQVVNGKVEIGRIRILGIGSSSVLQIGDAKTITCSSIFDSPPESLIVGPIEPFAQE
jgi:spore germination protein PD